ncbi:23422_t:CDS:2, partial [Racocetra persica]
MQNTQIQEYNVKVYIDDPEESLGELFDHFNQFVENLQDPAINSDYLPIGAILVEYNKASNHNKSTDEQKQPQPTIEELRYDIQTMIQNLEDLDVNHLQIVHDQISKILEDFRRPERSIE